MIRDDAAGGRHRVDGQRHPASGAVAAQDPVLAGSLGRPPGDEVVARCRGPHSIVRHGGAPWRGRPTISSGRQPRTRVTDGDVQPSSARPARPARPRPRRSRPAVGSAPRGRRRSCSARDLGLDVAQADDPSGAAAAVVGDRSADRLDPSVAAVAAAPPVAHAQGAARSSLLRPTARPQCRQVVGVDELVRPGCPTISSGSRPKACVTEGDTQCRSMCWSDSSTTSEEFSASRR